MAVVIRRNIICHRSTVVICIQYVPEIQYIICSIIQITLWWYYYINVIICIRYIYGIWLCDHKAQTDTDMSYKLSFVLFQIYDQYWAKSSGLIRDRIQTRFQGIKVDTEQNRGPLHIWARHQAKLYIPNS